MNQPLALTVSGHSIKLEPYNGSPSQSFKLSAQSDGSIGIRYLYEDLTITASDTEVWVSPYTGGAWQGFDLKEVIDGSYTIHTMYSKLALTTQADKLLPKTYVPSNKDQRFNLIEQADGSIGIRKIERSVFVGTPDPLEAIKRVGNWFFNSYRQSTGYYAQKNTQLTLELKTSGQSDPKLWIGAPFADPDTRYALPRQYSLQEGINTITDTGGGMIYLELIGETHTANLTFLQGALEVPFFEHKKTLAGQYHKMLDQWTQSPFVELTSAHALVTVSRNAALTHRDSDLNELMDTYEKIISVGEELIGLDGASPLHTRASMKFHFVLGNYGGGGYAHAGHGHTSYHENFAKELLTPKDLGESWGVAHELGHQNQMLAYLPGALVEVSNNVSSMAVQRTFNLPSTLLTKDSDGLDTWARLLKKLNTPDASIESLDLFERLAVLEQLRLAFGNQFWPRMNKITREKWNSNGYVPDRQQAFDNFAFFSCIAAQADLCDYCAAWGIPLSEKGKQAIIALGLPAPPRPPQTLREPTSLTTTSALPLSFRDCTSHSAKT